MNIKPGAYYRSPERREALKQMVKSFVEDPKNNYAKDEYCDRFLNELINTETLYPGYGFARSVEANNGYIHCVLVAQLQENRWYNRCDVAILGLLTNKKCTPTHIRTLFNTLEQWGIEREAKAIVLNAWRDSPAMDRVMNRIGFKTLSKNYIREIHYET